MVVPATPRWVPWVAGLLGVGLTVVSVALEPNTSFGSRLVRELTGVLTPLLFAAAGVGLVLEGWRRHQWRRSTQFLAVEAIDELRDGLADVAETVMALVTPVLPEVERHRMPVRQAFALPYTDIRADVFRDATAAVWPLSAALSARVTGLHLDADVDSELEASARAVGVDAEDVLPRVSLPADEQVLAGVVEDLLDRGADAAALLEQYADRVLRSGHDVSTLVAPDGPDLMREVLVLDQGVAALRTVVARGRSAPDVGAARECVADVHAVLLQCGACLRELSRVHQRVGQRGTEQLPDFIRALQAAGGAMDGLAEESLRRQMHAGALHRRHLRRVGDRDA